MDKRIKDTELYNLPAAAALIDLSDHPEFLDLLAADDLQGTRKSLIAGKTELSGHVKIGSCMWDVNIGHGWIQIEDGRVCMSRWLIDIFAAWMNSALLPVP